MNDPFSSIIGHGRAIEILRRQLSGGRLPHALLLSGPRHLGKRTVALALAAARLGTARPELHPDFRLVERERDPKTGKLQKHLPVDGIRALREHLRMSTFSGGAKVALIDESETMNESSSNALLKTLEEPSGDALLILVAHEPERVPATVRSRAARIDLRRVPERELAAALEARGVSAEAADEAAGLADGRPGTALAFLEHPDMLDWHRKEIRRCHDVRAAPLHRRFSLLSELAPPRADREESVARIRDAAAAWEAGLRRDARAGDSRAVPVLRALAALRADLDVNVQPRLLLERFALRLDT